MSHRSVIVAMALLAAGLLSAAVAGAETRLTCTLAGTLTAGGGKKTFTARENLRCPPDPRVLEIEGVSAEVTLIQSPARATRLTLNWGYVMKHREVKGAIFVDALAGAAVVGTCKAIDLGEDFSAQVSGADSAQCDLPADAFGRVDRVVIRGEGAFR